eukprot:TRINITY_DN67792_c0_g1_i1.p1 TRINITY_DN67792_c0_g1~~TRINITY_DN67792_c0_g1_i1.p1  ORF type:complete len:434 (-),score=12.75 TRINITY_DN67792_c0_g1_i1:409-1629(-)
MNGGTTSSKYNRERERDRDHTTNLIPSTQTHGTATSSSSSTSTTTTQITSGLPYPYEQVDGTIPLLLHNLECHTGISATMEDVLLSSGACSAPWILLQPPGESRTDLALFIYKRGWRVLWWLSIGITFLIFGLYTTILLYMFWARMLYWRSVGMWVWGLVIGGVVTCLWWHYYVHSWMLIRFHDRCVEVVRKPLWGLGGLINSYRSVWVKGLLKAQMKGSKLVLKHARTGYRVTQITEGKNGTLEQLYQHIMHTHFNNTNNSGATFSSTNTTPANLPSSGSEQALHLLQHDEPPGMREMTVITNNTTTGSNQISAPNAATPKFMLNGALSSLMRNIDDKLSLSEENEHSQVSESVTPTLGTGSRNGSGEFPRQDTNRSGTPASSTGFPSNGSLTFTSPPTATTFHF